MRVNTPSRALWPVAVATAAFTFTSPALAQSSSDTTGPQAQQTGEGRSEAIIVTGSRLARDSFNAPTPVNVVGAERMEDLGIANVGDALNQIPSFRPITSPSTNNFRATSNIAARTLDLRGLGASRTLVLIDGRRSVPSTEEGRFDLNSLPSIMVQRSEVVTGGASAAYGADAVAGVVNIILNTRFQGIKGEVSAGISEYGDAGKVHAGAMVGTPFAGGRGHLVLGGEYAYEDGYIAPRDRDWSRRFHGFIGNPFWKASGGNTAPQNIASDNVLFAINPGGVSTAVGPMQGLTFDAQGNLIPFQFGQYFNPASPGIQMVGGDPSIQDLYGCAECPLFVGNSHIATLGHLEYELSDAITARIEVAYSRVTGGPSSGTAPLNYGTSGPIIVRRDNPYLTPQAKAIMDARGVTSFAIGRSHQELGTAEAVSRNKTLRGMFGLSGFLGNGWDWDAYYSVGRTKGRLDTTNVIRNGTNDRWNQAIDPVLAPAGIPGIQAGTIICRSTITNPTNGCVPANVLGPNMISDGARAWVMGDYWQTRLFVQHAWAANLRGTLFQNWAGDVKFATGAEYRIDRSEGERDPLTAAGAFATATATVLPPLKQTVKEAYVEASLPLIADSSVGSIDLDGAVRYSDYNLQGGAWTWKVGAVWDINDALMVRVTRSHDVRQPNALELNPNTTSGRFPLNDPKLNTSYEILSVFGGNPNLELEIGNTWTAGVVVQPQFVPNLRLSLDYYDIKVSGAIDTISNTTAILLCRQGNTAVCTIGPDDRITQLRSTYQNVNELVASGIEGVLNYSHDVGADTRVNLTLNGVYVRKLETTFADGTKRSFAALTGNFGSISNVNGVPRWRTDAVLTFDNPLFSLTAQARYVPPSLLSLDHIGPHQAGYSVDFIQANDPLRRQSISNNRIEDKFYLNLVGSVKLYGPPGEDGVELFAGIDNVFDVDPPSNLRFFGNGLYYDNLGRYYKAGVRVEM